MDHSEIFQKLAAPFKASEIEWRLQAISEENMQGLAVPYIQSRAIQNRLDDVVNSSHWKNEFVPWRDDAQLCGISILFTYDDGTREWVTKWDGSGNSDIEPIKGGLSDSFKRSAVQWNIGRYLYQMGSIWVGIEKRGKSFGIAKSEQAKLDDFYNKEVDRIIKGLPAAVNNSSGFNADNTGHQGAESRQASRKQADNTGKQSKSSKAQDLQQSLERNVPEQNNAGSGTPEPLYFVSEKKTSSNEYGESTQVKLVDMNDGTFLEAFVRGQAPGLSEGVKLRNVKVTLKNGRKRDYYTLDSFDIAA